MPPFARDALWRKPQRGFRTADDASRPAHPRADGTSGRDHRSWIESAEHRAVARAIEAGDPDTIAIELGDWG